MGEHEEILSQKAEHAKRAVLNVHSVPTYYFADLSKLWHDCKKSNTLQTNFCVLHVKTKTPEANACIRKGCIHQCHLCFCGTNYTPLRHFVSQLQRKSHGHVQSCFLHLRIVYRERGICFQTACNRQASERPRECLAIKAAQLPH